MALSFNCGQFEQAFDSKRLQQWEKRNSHRRRPLTKEGFTQPIANNRGHLLPSIPRSARSPWGTFVGTWDLPKRLPGNKMTDPMARSADAHFRNMELKGEADVVINGQDKHRRPQAGQPLRAMPNHCPTPPEQKPASHRSGAANPIMPASGSPKPVTPMRQCTPPCDTMAEPIHPELIQAGQAAGILACSPTRPLSNIRMSPGRPASNQKMSPLANPRVPSCGEMRPISNQLADMCNCGDSPLPPPERYSPLRNASPMF